MEDLKKFWVAEGEESGSWPTTCLEASLMGAHSERTPIDSQLDLAGPGTTWDTTPPGRDVTCVGTAWQRLQPRKGGVVLEAERLRHPRPEPSARPTHPPAGASICRAVGGEECTQQGEPSINGAAH